MKNAITLNGHYLFEDGVLEFDRDVEIHCCRFGTSALPVDPSWVSTFPQHNIMFVNPSSYKVLLTSTESMMSPNRETPEVIVANHTQYDLILTTDPLILSACNNAVFFPYGTTWLNQGHINHPDGLGKFDEEYLKQFWKDKKLDLSFLCSVHNRDASGYDLRKELWSKKDDITIPTSFYASPRNPPPLPPGPLGADLLLNDDRSGLYKSQFSVAIENALVDNYFTEKLMDCFLTKTVPVYYGCPNIVNFFEPKGIIDITHNSADEAIAKVNTITGNTYLDMLPYVEENYERALEYCQQTFAHRVKNAIDSSLEDSNSDEKLLSIGILSLDDETRRGTLNRLLNLLNQQMTIEFKKKVEILINIDDGSKQVGTKRNEILDSASGKYVCFIDDDDMVDERYVQNIIFKLEENPDLDCVGFTGMFYLEDNPSMMFRHANEYGGHFKDFKGVQHRPVNHLNPVRLEIAKQIRFADQNFGEDSDYCDRLFASGLLKKEAIIKGNVVMYHYLWNPDETRTHENPHDAIPVPVSKDEIGQ